MELKQLRTLAAAATFALAAAAPQIASSQVAASSLASASQLIAENAGGAVDSPQAGYCPASSERDVWDDTAWVMFSRTLSSCDGNGNSVTTEGQLYLANTWNPSYRWQCH